MALTKARIDIEKAAELGDAIECLFNPTNFSQTKTAKWAAKPTKGSGEDNQVFVTTESGSLAVDLVFDTADTGLAVTQHTDRLLRLVEPTKNLPADQESKRPPFVWFRWGMWTLFDSELFVNSVALTYDYFSPEGVPLRATAKVGFEQAEPSVVANSGSATGLQNPTSHTPKPHRIHRIQRGESLDRIAHRYYGDPTEWTRVAVANGITDPIRLRVGTLLRIPKRSARDG